MRAPIVWLLAALAVIEFTSADRLEPDPELLGKIYDLQKLVGQVLLDFNNFNQTFAEALAQGHFQNAQASTKVIYRSIQILRDITSSTDELLQLPQIAKYRTMTAAARIINNTCSSMGEELESVLPVVEGGVVTRDDVREKVLSISQQISTGHSLLKRYLDMLIVHA
ncbi:uncharacterized protein LOC115265645 [Aedes albopictus]|uniref:Secreted protein n=1 Tax=Aedes albopictus TaxID=7160 RepID=A0ABM1YGQ0_AEDAL|nr:uncharacterized protein LOC115265645 [Aedes albopictus]